MLACAQNLRTAKELWRDACGLVMANAELAAQVVARRESLGDETLRFANGGEYRLVAADERAPAGSPARFSCSMSWRFSGASAAWPPSRPSTPRWRWRALPARVSCSALRAAPSMTRVLMNRMLDAQADDLLVLRWVTPERFEADNPRGWVYSNPSIGRGLTVGEVASAFELFRPEGFRREYLGQTVAAEDRPIPTESWAACADPGSTLDPARPLAACLDVAPDGDHASLVAAQPAGERLRLETVAAWDDPAVA